MAHIRGEIDEFIDRVRMLMGDRGRTLLDSDSLLVDAANRVAEQIFMDLLLPAETGYGEYSSTITYVADQEYYSTPYGLLRMREVSVLDDDGLKCYDLDSIHRDEKHLRPGYWLEHDRVGIAPIPDAADSDALKLYYVRKPVPVHRGEAQAVTATSITLAKTAQLGRVLTRDNAYLGARVQVIDATANEGETAVVTAYVGSTCAATVAWDNTPTGTVTYEVMPDLPPEARGLWESMTAWQCLMDEDAGSSSKLTMLAASIESQTRTLRNVAMTRVRTRTGPLGTVYGPEWV